MNIEEHQVKKKQSVPLSVRLDIIHWKKNGETDEEVSQRVGYPRSTVNYIYNKFLKQGIVENIKPPGRPKQVSEEEEEMLIEAVEAHPDLTLNGLIEEIDAPFGKTKAHTILKEHGFRNYTAPEKWALTSEHKELRLQWAKKYRRLLKSYWEKVIFTDETLVQNNPHKQKFWVADKDSLPLIKTDRWKVSVLCWGAISFEGKFILEIVDESMGSDKYLNILKKRLLRNLPALSPFTKLGASLNKEDRLIFQQDRSSVHTAKAVMDYFHIHSIEVLPWPPKSPDLNLIESVWSELKSNLKRTYENRQDLEEDIYRSWNSLSIEYIQNLYDSMCDRISAVIESEGEPTRY